MQQADARATSGMLVPLAAAAGRASEVGAKAANLGAALAAGFPVPDGFVLAAEARGPDDELSPPVEDALREALAALGGPLAVRSSALAEDLTDASYAGQYETVLGVEGFEALRAAVRRCWASATNERVESYEQGRARTAPRGMAVLIQRLVPADAAGVAFTVNPVSGDRAETLVSAVRGLGDRLVSGEATPDEWTVRGDAVECRSLVEGAIDAEQTRAVAALARRAQAHFGGPQDIEWAIAGGELFLLQARPITALAGATEVVEPVPVPVEVPPGFWEREASHTPLPHTPMNRSLLFDRRNAAFRDTFARFGVLAEGLEFREIGGWEYSRLVPLGGKEGSPPPAPVMWLLARLHPALRRRMRAAREALRSDLSGRTVQRWHDEIRPDLDARIRALRDIDLPALPDNALLEYWRRVDALLDDALPVHFDLHAPVAIARKQLVDACRELLGWDEPRAFELLAGLSTMSTAPAARLAALAQLAAQRPAERTLVERADRGAAATLAAADPEFAAAFEAYQRDFGVRGLRYDVAEATLEESPEITLATLRDQLRRGYDPSTHLDALAARRAELRRAAREALARRPAADRERFEDALASAERAHPVHEENEFYTISAPIAVTRYALLELGRRLAERGVIAARDDVFFLEIGEALEAFETGGERRALVTRRKGERAWVLAHLGPASYGADPGPPPPLQVLPREARLVMEAVLWSVDRSFGAEQSARRQAADLTVLTGTAASAGRYTGTVRLVMGEREFGKIEAGDVLVCPVTSPVWSVLFSRIGALVTDTGGILSHPAIIAREYGIPAVVATGNATALLRDGERVTVDGDAGLVERLS